MSKVHGLGDGTKAVWKLGIFGLSWHFPKEVFEGVRFRSCDQLTKALGDDFKVSSCWMFGQKMKGVRTVRWNGRTLKV